MTILNLTQHAASAEQRQAGVVDPSPRDAEIIRSASTFDTLPTTNEVREQAEELSAIANSALAENPSAVMIGGAPFLMAPLERALVEIGLTPVYAFSRRESVEETLADGSVAKRAVFRHLGFVEAQL